MEPINQRIKMFRESLGLNQTEFSKALGLKNPSNISMIEKTKGGFNILIVEKITKKYPNLNIDWLLRGEGTMLKISNIYQKSEDKLQNSVNYANITAGKAEPFRIDIELLMEEITFLKEILHIKDKQIESLKKPSALAS